MSEPEEEEQQQNGFPVKLHRLLDEMEETGERDIVSWLKDGTGFKIKDRKKFALEIMPRFFGSNKIKSFQRNLNLWGFASGKKLDERGIYTHKDFRRGRPELCSTMQRRRKALMAGTRGGNKKKLAAASNEHPKKDDSSSSSSSNSSVSTSDTSKNVEQAKQEKKKPPAVPREAAETEQAQQQERILTRNFSPGSSSNAIIQELRRRHERLPPQVQQEHSSSILNLPISTTSTVAVPAVAACPQATLPSLLQDLFGGGGLSSCAPPGSIQITFFLQWHPPH